MLLTAPAFSDRENSRALADRVPAAAQEPLPAAQMPKMIRITIGIDNPNGKLDTQQLFEYIFVLPS